MLRLPNGHLMKPMERPRTIIQAMLLILLSHVRPGRVPERAPKTFPSQSRSNMMVRTTSHHEPTILTLTLARDHSLSLSGLSMPQPSQTLIRYYLAIAVPDLKSTWIQADIFVLVSMMILPGRPMILPVRELPREAMPTVSGTMSKW